MLVSMDRSENISLDGPALWHVTVLTHPQPSIAR